MACAKCGAPTPKRYCQTHRVSESHEGLEADDLGWNRDEDEEGEE